MTRDTFYLVDDLKINIEKLLKPSDNPLDSQCLYILKLVYEHLESFEETAKTTLRTDLHYLIRSEVHRLRGIVAKIGPVQFSYEDVVDEDYQGDDEEDEDEDDDKEDEDDEDKDADKEDEDSDHRVHFSIEEEENLKQEVHSFTHQLKMEEQRCGDEVYNSTPDEEEEDGDDEDDHGVHFSIDEVENLKQGLQSFTRQLKKEEQRCGDGAYSSIPDKEEEEEDENRDHIASAVIGVHDVYEELKDKLMQTQLTSLVGMPGIGKTTLANKLFHDPTMVDHFDHRVWIRVGKRCLVKDIPRLILAAVDPDSLPNLPEGDVEAVCEHLKAILKSQSYLIVLDDVWDRYASYLLHPFHRYECNELNHPFLHPESQSRVLLTSRLQQINQDLTGLNRYYYVVTMRLLNTEESWDLLSDKVFCKGLSCPAHLVKVGTKIAEKCEGLPLTIVTVARLLFEEECTLEYWDEVAAKRNHRVFIDAYDEIYEVLLPSYTYLPRLLQMCFLYVGLFPQSFEVSRSKLINLWVVDRFLELNLHIVTNFDAISCLEELVSNNLVRVYKQSSYNFSHTVKTCGLHSSLWHLSKRKAKETKFALILSCPDDCFGDDMEGHRRLSIQSNVLFGMKDVHESVEDNCAFDARSLLCFGPYHQYQVPLCFRLKLLRELDALSIRFYEFPMEVIQLIHLRYLALTLNGMIPASISQLQFLEFFIVDRHQSIKSCKDASYLPVEIWSLQVLKHLQVMGRDLPDPRAASLCSLEALLNVSARSCTEAVFKGIPNLMELKVQIELTPEGDGKPLSCFTHISHLSHLRKLKCVVVNPVVVPPVAPFTNFPENLQNLSFSGLGYPWKELNKIASLPNLLVLKLKNYAFQGPEWEVEETGFTQLLSLIIEDTDVVSWKLGHGAFEGLCSLIIKSCYKLKKIHGKFSEDLQKIELIDCNPACVEEMKKAIPEVEEFDVHSSWEDRKLKK